MKILLISSFTVNLSQYNGHRQTQLLILAASEIENINALYYTFQEANLLASYLFLVYPAASIELNKLEASTLICDAISNKVWISGCLKFRHQVETAPGVTLRRLANCF